MAQTIFISLNHSFYFKNFSLSRNIEGTVLPILSQTLTPCLAILVVHWRHLATTGGDQISSALSKLSKYSVLATKIVSFRPRLLTSFVFVPLWHVLFDLLHLGSRRSCLQLLHILLYMDASMNFELDSSYYEISHNVTQPVQSLTIWNDGHSLNNIILTPAVIIKFITACNSREMIQDNSMQSLIFISHKEIFPNTFVVKIYLPLLIPLFVIVPLCYS